MTIQDQTQKKDDTTEQTQKRDDNTEQTQKRDNNTKQTQKRDDSREIRRDKNTEIRRMIIIHPRLICTCNTTIPRSR
jgi:hypothetical protein